MFVWEDRCQPPGQRLRGYGTAVFLSDSYAQALLRQPKPFVANGIFRSVLEGRSVLLDKQGIRVANSGPGVNLFSPEPVFTQKDWTSPQCQPLGHLARRAYHTAIAGYRLHRLLQEGSLAIHRELIEHSGWTTCSEFEAAPAVAGPQTTAGQPPFLAWITRQDAMARPWAMDTGLFWYPAPRFYFTPAEQGVLSLALRDYSDDAIVAELGISLSAVKKLWRAIFQRTKNEVPDFFPASQDNAGSSKRGVEKRRQLLAYLRQHPEELRPVIRPGGR